MVNESVDALVQIKCLFPVSNLVILKYQVWQLFQCYPLSHRINHSQGILETYPSKILFFLFHIYLTFKFPTENYSTTLDNQYVIQQKYKARGNAWCNWIKYLKDITSIFKTFFVSIRNFSLHYWSVTDFSTLNKQFRLVVPLQKIWEPQLWWALTTTQIILICVHDQHFCGRKTLSGVCILDTIESEIKISFTVGKYDKRIKIKQHFIQLEMQ